MMPAFLQSEQRTGGKFAYTVYAVSAKGTKFLGSNTQLMLTPTKALIDFESKATPGMRRSGSGGSEGSGRAPMVPVTREAQTESLKEALRKYRIDEAEKRQLINPLHIFDDVSLDQIASDLPRNKAALSKIAGMNEHRLVEYGPSICAIVSQVSPQQPIATGQGPELDPRAYENLNPALSDPESPFYLPFPRRPFHQLTTAKMEVWERFQINKESAQAIAADKNRPRQESTIVGYLADAVRAGFPVDIDRLGVEEKLKFDLSALADGKYVGNQIKTAYPEWSWGEINIVSAVNVIRDGVVWKTTTAVPAPAGGAPSQAAHQSTAAPTPRLPPIQQPKTVKHRGNALISEDDDEASPTPRPVRMPPANKPLPKPTISSSFTKIQSMASTAAPVLAPAPLPSPEKLASPAQKPIDAIDLLDEIDEDTEPRVSNKRKREDEDEIVDDDEILLVSSDDDTDVRAPKRLKTAPTVPSLLFHETPDAMEVEPTRALTQLPTEESLQPMLPPSRPKLPATEDTVFAFLRGARGSTREELEEVFDSGNLAAVMDSLTERFSIYQKDVKYFCL
eukprot:TRINITY_DN4171_c1_g1_i1.p1 TRINITY_DN4171_c1_g1~~TRINITY_DN4171_c1_g1_i1.p1  ORF type:complete len:564 (-),score=111.06 TRINITY_DN4171_c1_g1_i1:128-1819(-)